MRSVKQCVLFLFIVIQGHVLTAQVYMEKQTRHRFAQMTLGLDYHTSFGGYTSYINPAGSITSFDLGPLQTPSVLIGGTHFWGHADFYIAIPLLNESITEAEQKVSYTSGLETVFKYYPWRIERHRIRPFAGVSIAPFKFQQTNKNLHYGTGPTLIHTSLPLMAGFTYSHKAQLFEFSLLWNYAHEQTYYLSKSVASEISTPPLYLSISYKVMFETTLSAEPQWESGKTLQYTNALADLRRLNNFYISLGISSSFWQNGAGSLAALNPFVMDYPISVMPDLAVGYYLHKPDLNISLNYRQYSTSTRAYEIFDDLKRKSIGFEVTKFLFDYHGFVPFMGPILTYDQLSFYGYDQRTQTYSTEDKQWNYGLTFGWDIRPNRIQTWLLRTNLRWFPDIKLQLDDNTDVSFDNVEFNFIQLVVFPGRIF